MKWLALLLAGLILLMACDHPKQDATTGKVPGKDALLGKWVCLADNIHEWPNAALEFKADGTATLIAEENKPVIMRYRREPGREWVARRREGLAKIGIDMGGAGSAFAAWERPGIEMVYFADPKTGEFIDSGGLLLILDPDKKTLSNPLTFLWCRPGDEEKVREESGMNEGAKRTGR